jgi:chloramphenicol-sensitive protein RarD
MLPSARVSAAKREERSALIAGFAAFATQGLIPVYWKLLKTVPAIEIIAHRFRLAGLLILL